MSDLSERKQVNDFSSLGIQLSLLTKVFVQGTPYLYNVLFYIYIMLFSSGFYCGYHRQSIFNSTKKASGGLWLNLIPHQTHDGCYYTI